MAELWIKGNDMPLVRAREVDEKGNVCFDYRPVHMYTLTNEVEVVGLKKRTY
jgi:hypothetical protein